MITEDYVSFEVAKLLKKKGFDAGTNTYYYATSEYTKSEMYKSPNNMYWNNDEYYYSAPTHQMAMKWLREEKQIYVCPKLRCFEGKQPYYKWEATILRLPSNNIIYPQPMDMCKHYESYTEAVEAALKYSLENLV